MDKATTQMQSIWYIIFVASFKLYKQIWRKCLPLSIFYSLCWLIYELVIPDYKLIEDKMVKITSGHPGLMILFGILGALSFACLFYQVITLLQKNNTTVGKVLQHGVLRGILAAVSLFIFYIVFTICAYIVLLILKFVPVVGPLIAVILIIGGLFYLLVSLFSWYPLMMEGMGAIAAFKQSFRLSKNSWWRIFCFSLILFLFVMLVYAIIGTLIYVLFNIVYAAPQLSMVFSFIVTVIIAPWVPGVILLQVENLKLAYQANSTFNAD